MLSSGYQPVFSCDSPTIMTCTVHGCSYTGHGIYNEPDDKISVTIMSNESACMYMMWVVVVYSFHMHTALAA